jgi:hypothetical protein
MYNLDTKEEVDMGVFFEALENGEIIIDGRHMTEEDHKETSRKIAEYKAIRQSTKIKEAVLV